MISLQRLLIGFINFRCDEAAHLLHFPSTVSLEAAGGRKFDINRTRQFSVQNSRFICVECPTLTKCFFSV